MKRVYISGPISNMPDLNRPAFALAADVLTAYGWEVVNPFDVCPSPGSWAEAMRADIKALMDCTHIHLLDGWQRSRGAVIEARIACDLGIQRVELHAEPAA